MTIKYTAKPTNNKFYENIQLGQDFINLLKECNISQFIVTQLYKDRLNISFSSEFYNFKIIIFESPEILDYIKKDINNNFVYIQNVFYTYKLENNYDYFANLETKLFNLINKNKSARN